MTVTLGDAVVFITGDSSGLESTLDDSRQQTDSWVSNLGSNVTNLLGGAILGGAALAGTAILGIGAAGINAASQLRQSQNDIIASLGVTEERAKELGQVGLEVFKNNFGASIEDATASVIEARKQLGNLSDIELQKATENALAMADVFDIDIGESLNAAKALTDKFGLSQQEAFDFMTTGFQKGLNSSGDFLDSISEYSGLFADGKGSSSQFFSLLESGLQAGVSGTDKVADAFKEFSLRIADGSDSSSQALGSLFGTFTNNSGEIDKATEKVLKLEKQLTKASGARRPDFARMAELTAEIEKQKGKIEELNSSNGEFNQGFSQFQGGMGEFLAQLNDGTLSTVDSFSIITKALQDIEDPIQRDAIGVALLGTQYEDLGRNAVAGIDLTITSQEDLAGSTDKLNAKYDNFGSIWETIKRRATVALIPIGEKLLSLADRVMPKVLVAFSWFEKGLPVLLQQAGKWFDWLVGIIETNIVPFVNDTLIPAFQDFGKWFVEEGLPAIQEFLAPIIAEVIPGLELLGDIVSDLAATVFPLWIEWIQFLTDNWNLILPVLGIVSVALIAIVSPIALIIGAIVLLATAWANNWGGIQDKAQQVFDFLQPLFETAMSFISGIVTDALAFILGWWNSNSENILTVVMFLWTTAVALFNQGLELIQSIISTVLEFLLGLWDTWGATILEIFTIMWETVKTILAGAFEILGLVFEAFVALIEGNWTVFMDILNEIWATAWELIRTFLFAQFEIIKRIITVAIGVITAIWTAMSTNLKLIWTKLWTAIHNKIQEKITAIKAALTDFKAFWSNVWNAIASKLSSIVNRIKGKLNSIVRTIKKVIKKIADLISKISSVPLLGGLSSQAVSAESNVPANNISSFGAAESNNIKNNTINFTQQVFGTTPEETDTFNALRATFST